MEIEGGMSTEDEVTWEIEVVAHFTDQMIAKQYEAALTELNAALTRAREAADGSNRVEFFEKLKEFIVTQWADAIRAGERQRPADIRGEPDALLCSFCGKGKDEVKQVIAGPQVFICNECIDICNEILADQDASPAGSPLDTDS